MGKPPIIDLGTRPIRPKRRIVFTCLAAASLGLCLASALLWWDSQTTRWYGAVGNRGWTSNPGELSFVHFGRGPLTGPPNAGTVSIDVRHWFSYATREDESFGNRRYQTFYYFGDRLLCILFGILPSAWLIAALRRHRRQGGLNHGLHR